MFLGKVEGQTAGLNVSAINRSAANKSEIAQGQKQQDERMDKITLSPKGKKQSFIEQLMKQKERIQESKQSALDNAAEHGSGDIQQQLDEYDQQLKDIDAQIAKLQTESTESIYEKPKTVEEAEANEISKLTQLSVTSDQAELMASVQDKLDGRVRVLESEVKSGNGNIQVKLEEISEIKAKSEELTPKIGERLEEVNADIAGTNDIAVEEKVEENELTNQ